jgi:hypothetical protein
VAFAVSVLCALSRSEAAQKQAEGEDAYYYQISGIVYIWEYDLKTHALGQERIPNAGLRFDIVGKAAPAAGSGQGLYHIIQFPAILSDEFVSDSKLVSKKDNGKYFAIRVDEFDAHLADGFIEKRYQTWSPRPTFGASLAVPFKLRFKTRGQNIKLNTDVTLGGYVGAKMRLDSSRPYYVSLIATLGLAFLPLNDNNNPPTDSMASKGDSTVVGVTGSVGLVMELSDFQLGILVGIDRAAGETGKDWIYNNKPWVSFSIGYAFFGSSEPKAAK